MGLQTHTNTCTHIDKKLHYALHPYNPSIFFFFQELNMAAVSFPPSLLHSTDRIDGPA